MTETLLRYQDREDFALSRYSAEVLQKINFLYMKESGEKKRNYSVIQGKKATGL